MKMKIRLLDEKFEFSKEFNDSYERRMFFEDIFEDYLSKI
jgi:hypothetical protein